MTTLLRYDVKTDPFPLQASADKGNLTSVQLTIVAANPNPASVVPLQGLIITMPVGQAGTDLTPDPTSIGPIPPTNWKLADTQHPPGSVRYIFYPFSGHGAVGSEGLSFTFNNVQVNRQPGTVQIEVMEGSSGCQSPNCPTQPLDVTKFPNGWGLVSFWVDPADISTGESVTLHWDGPAGATYTIEYSTPQTGIVRVPVPGQPKLASQGQYPGQNHAPLTLSQTTLFTLDVEESIAGRTYHAQDQKTVNVAIPSPQIQLFTGELGQKPAGMQLHLNWRIEGAAERSLSGVSSLLTSEGSQDIIPTVQEPLLISYTLTATNPAGTATSQLIMEWGKVQVTVPTGVGPHGVAVSPDNAHVFVTNYDDSTVSVIDALTLQPVMNAIQGVSHPWGVAISPDNSRVFVTNLKDSTVSVFNAQSLQPIATIGVGHLPVGVAIASLHKSTRVFVTNYDDATVSVIDAQSLQPIGTIQVGQAPWGVAIASLHKSTRVFVTNGQDNTVSVIDAQSLQPIGTIQVGQAPWGVAVSPDNSRVFVTNGQDNTVSVIDALTLQPVGAPIAVGNAPIAVAVSPDNSRVFVTNGQDNTVSVIDAQSQSLQPMRTIGVGHLPYGVAVSPDNAHVFVTNRGDRTVSVIVPSSVSGGTSPQSIDTAKEEYFMTTVEVPVGTIISYVGSKDTLGKRAEEGWIPCDGTSLERNAYPELFAVIGVAFGSDDAIHFNAPDLRGMFQRGVNDSSGKDPDAAQRTRQGDNSIVGDVVGSRQDQQLLNHAHNWDHFFWKTSFHDDDIAVFQASNSPNLQYNTGVATNKDGGGDETRPKNVAVYYLIKAFSSFNRSEP